MDIRVSLGDLGHDGVHLILAHAKGFEGLLHAANGTFRALGRIIHLMTAGTFGHHHRLPVLMIMHDCYVPMAFALLFMSHFPLLNATIRRRPNSALTKVKSDVIMIQTDAKEEYFLSRHESEPRRVKARRVQQERMDFQGQSERASLSRCDGALSVIKGRRISVR